MARGTSPVMTAVSMNCPIAGRFLSSWERDNSVIVRENKTTDSSAQRCLWLVAWICIWIQQAFKGAYLLCKVAFMRHRVFATACHRFSSNEGRKIAMNVLLCIHSTQAICFARAGKSTSLPLSLLHETVFIKPCWLNANFQQRMFNEISWIYVSRKFYEQAILNIHRS